MPATKFGLFKSKSRDYQEQPSTENLLQDSGGSNDQSEEHTVALEIPSSPIPSTSKGIQDHNFTMEEFASLNIDSDEDEDVGDGETASARRSSDCSQLEDTHQLQYQKLNDQISTDDTSISTTQDEDYEQIQIYNRISSASASKDDQDGASTSCDANSIQLDSASITSDRSVHCGPKKPKKNKSKVKKLLRDIDMWKASDVVVMQNLLYRSGNVDDQIKWEAIATARGLCTLTASCACRDCIRAKFLNGGMADGDGGLGAAPLIGAISFGCAIQ